MNYTLIAYRSNGAIHYHGECEDRTDSDFEIHTGSDRREIVERHTKMRLENLVLDRRRTATKYNTDSTNEWRLIVLIDGVHDDRTWVEGMHSNGQADEARVRYEAAFAEFALESQLEFDRLLVIEDARVQQEKDLAAANAADLEARRQRALEKVEREQLAVLQAKYVR